MRDGAFLPGAIALALAVLPAAKAVLAQDIERGRGLAAVRCTSCHSVDGHAGAPNPVGRAFTVIASQPDLNGDRLREWLAAPHAQMPDPDLEDDEIADLVAYILSLKHRR